MKIYPDAAAALDGVLQDDISIMVGGFGLCGIPEALINEAHRSGKRGLTIISNNCGMTGDGLWHLLNEGQIRKIILSFIGDNKLLEDKILNDAIETELVPQGTLSERIRAGGAGIPAFFTATGYGTVVADGKPVQEFEGRHYIMERWLRADLSIIRAWKADPEGNLVFRKTARNFNPMMATAAKVTVVEVEEIVPLGALSPDEVHTPGIFVDRIVQSKPSGRIERLTERKREMA